MKLIIQICCYNEEEALPKTLAALPRHIEGFDVVEWLIVDDGSRDGTHRIAIENGVDHIVKNVTNQGLAYSFMRGLNECLLLGADVIVNTDADNQYNADDIPKLIEPITSKNADFVIGSRPISSIMHFSYGKKIAQRVGSMVVRVASKTNIPDATSGFRALSRNFAHQVIVFSSYTYTLETIILAGRRNMLITSVPIRVNADLRPSRLLKSNAHYIKLSIITIFRIFSIYQSFRFFLLIGGVLSGAGFLIGMRFLILYAIGDGEGHTQSLILSAILLGMGFQTILMAFIGDSLAANRKFLEEIRFTSRLKDFEANNSKLKI